MRKVNLSTTSTADLNSHYLAFVISEESRALLLTLFPPRYEKIVCHHVTLKFDLSKGLTVIENNFLENSVNVQLSGVRDDGHGIQALVVTVNGKEDRTDGSFYHITHSHSPEYKPVSSKKLKADQETSAKEAIKISGKVCLVKK